MSSGPPAPPQEPPKAAWEDLFDELVDLPPAARAARLEALRAAEPELAARLARLLAADGSLATMSILASLRQLETGSTSAEATESAFAPGALLGPWRLVRPLGHGGMGEVFLAERADGAFVQDVAIKAVHLRGRSPAFVERFLRERQILAGLQHPNIARLIDGGTAADGRPYLVLERVDGLPITEYCRVHGVGLEARLQLVRTVCEAVDAAHRRLVVHCDLKPANILVDATGTVKLLDFGIATILARDPTAGPEPVGGGDRLMTPSYASPEQVASRPLSVASDVYSLGVVLAELLTGELPYPRDTTARLELKKAIVGGRVDRPSVVLRRSPPAESAAWTRRVDADLDAIVLTAMALEPERRYRSPAALGEDLGRYLESRPVRARDGGAAYRLRKLVARHRLAVAGLTLGVVSLVVGLLVALVQAQAARLEARRADAESRRAERVQSFLVSIFHQSDPDVSLGRDVTARELLAAGAERIEHELVDEPEVRADLLQEIGRIELNLGLLEPALEHARASVRLRRSLRPTDAGRIAVGQVLIAEVLSSSGRVDQVRVAIAAALPVLRESYGDESLEVAAAERELGAALYRPEEHERAIELLRHAARIESERLGPDHERTARTLSDLGIVLEQAQRYDEAEAVYRQAVAVLEERLGPDHPRLAEALADLASLLDRLSARDEARPLFERAIAIQRQALGPHHERLAASLFSYGILELTAQQYPAADAALGEALAIFGPDRYEAAHCLRYLGLTAADQGRFDDAAALLARAADTYERTLGSDDLQRHRALANLGWVHLKLGRLAQAQAELRAAVAAIERLAGAESYEIRVPLKQLGEAETTTDPAAAVATLRRVRELEEKLFGGRDHREIAGSDLLLADALVTRDADGDRAEARRRLDESLDIFARIAPEDFLRSRTLVASARLAFDEGDRERTRRELVAARELLVARDGPSDALEEVDMLLASLHGGR